MCKWWKAVLNLGIWLKQFCAPEVQFYKSDKGKGEIFLHTLSMAVPLQSTSFPQYCILIILLVCKYIYINIYVLKTCI